MTYTHFSIEEREIIQKMLWEKQSIRAIARILDRSHTSVSREIKRHNPVQRKRYTPRLAHTQALEKRKNRGRTQRLKNERIRIYVITHLKERWSPEQIAGRMKTDRGECISHEAIYQYIYTQVHRNGYGLLRPGCVDLRSCLRRKQKRRQKNGMRRSQRILTPRGVSIDERPLIVEKRTRIGDWESDSVESKDHKPGINTLVDRMSGIVCITKLKDKTSAATAHAIIAKMECLPQNARYTMTFDNGSENQGWRAIESALGMKTYFAHPYHSWERGSNENTNGLIRDYFPKKTDFTMIPEEDLAHVEQALNNRPRKRHGWRTPLEIFSGALRC